MSQSGNNAREITDSQAIFNPEYTPTPISELSKQKPNDSSGTESSVSSDESSDTSSDRPADVADTGACPTEQTAVIPVSGASRKSTSPTKKASKPRTKKRPAPITSINHVNTDGPVTPKKNRLDQYMKPRTPPVRKIFSLFYIVTILRDVLLVDHIHAVIKFIQSDQTFRNQPKTVQSCLHLLVKNAEKHITPDCRGQILLHACVPKDYESTWYTTLYDVATTQTTINLLRDIIAMPETVTFIQELQTATASLSSSSIPQNPRDSTTTMSSTTVRGTPEDVRVSNTISICVPTSFDDLLPENSSQKHTSPISSSIFVRKGEKLFSWKSESINGDILVDLKVYPTKEIRSEDPKDWWRKATFRGKVCATSSETIYRQALTLVSSMIDQVRQQPDAVDALRGDKKYRR
ncbi:hypothetical protein [Halyomorpha halys erranti-like virus 1]|nr:hypothetical protein [Halyomorpha halys erranti-like virus 1]